MFKGRYHLDHDILRKAILNDGFLAARSNVLYRNNEFINFMTNSSDLLKIIRRKNRNSVDGFVMNAGVIIQETQNPVASATVRHRFGRWASASEPTRWAKPTTSTAAIPCSPATTLATPLTRSSCISALRSPMWPAPPNTKSTTTTLRVEAYNPNLRCH